MPEEFLFHIKVTLIVGLNFRLTDKALQIRSDNVTQIKLTRIPSTFLMSESLISVLRKMTSVRRVMDLILR